VPESRDGNAESSAPTRESSSTTVRQRKTGIRTLHSDDSEGDKKEKDGNPTYNGNSTNQL
jgi:hypothetical protein